LGTIAVVSLLFKVTMIQAKRKSKRGTFQCFIIIRSHHNKTFLIGNDSVDRISAVSIQNMNSQYINIVT